MNKTVQGIMEAIARFEGFYVSGSLAQRNNNPGNLRPYSANQPQANGYRTFSNIADGWAALRKQVELNISRGLTLYEFFGGKPGVYAGYAPSGDNNKPVQYAQYVAKAVKIDPSVVISKAMGAAGAIISAAVKASGTAGAISIFAGTIALYVWGKS